MLSIARVPIIKAIIHLHTGDSAVTVDTRLIQLSLSDMPMCNCNDHVVNKVSEIRKHTF